MVIEKEDKLLAIESKSGATIASDSFSTLLRFEQQVNRSNEDTEVLKYLAYGGDSTQKRSRGTALPWKRIHTIPMFD